MRGVLRPGPGPKEKKKKKETEPTRRRDLHQVSKKICNFLSRPRHHEHSATTAPPPSRSSRVHVSGESTAVPKKRTLMRATTGPPQLTRQGLSDLRCLTPQPQAAFFLSYLNQLLLCLAPAGNGEACLGRGRQAHRSSCPEHTTDEGHCRCKTLVVSVKTSQQ